MSTYAVKEVFATLQGEGARTGRPSVFCRFARCNLWTGREADRANAICRFCDTDFVGTNGPGGGVFHSAADLADHVRRVWDSRWGSGAGAAAVPPYVVCTGGEPLLQLDEALTSALHDRGFEVAIETNGTLPVPPGVDWVCVSPKADALVVVETGDELKLVHPQPGAEPERFSGLAFDHFFLQPMDGPERAAHTSEVVERCAGDPRWKVSLQAHKLIGIP